MTEGAVLYYEDWCVEAKSHLFEVLLIFRCWISNKKILLDVLNALFWRLSTIKRNIFILLMLLLIFMLIKRVLENAHVNTDITWIKFLFFNLIEQINDISYALLPVSLTISIGTFRLVLAQSFVITLTEHFRIDIRRFIVII